MKHRAKRKKHKPKGHHRKSSGKHHRKPPPYHSRAPPSVLSFQKNQYGEKMRSKNFFQLFFIFELPKRRLLHYLYERENRTPLSQARKEVRK